MSEKKLYAILFCILLNIPCYADVIAPALQYLREDYPSFFISNIDYSIKLKTQTRYKLKCSSNITAITTGDKENMRSYNNDEFEEKLLYELLGPNDVTIKTKYETYTYMQIFKENSKPTTALVSINKKNVVPNIISIDDCTIVEKTN